jgi:hypothetical protein
VLVLLPLGKRLLVTSHGGTLHATHYQLPLPLLLLALLLLLS